MEEENYYKEEEEAFNKRKAGKDAFVSDLKKVHAEYNAALKAVFDKHNAAIKVHAEYNWDEEVQDEVCTDVPYLYFNNECWYTENFDEIMQGVSTLNPQFPLH